MLNKYTKPCFICAEKVEAGTGVVFLQNGAWNTYHNDCWEKIKPPEVPPGVKVTVEENTVYFGLVGFHERHRFDSYRTCTNGMTYSAGRKENYTNDFDRAISAIQALRATDFMVYMEKDHEELLKRHIEAAFNVPAEVMERANDVRLRPYQREGVYWLATKNRALLGDDMGLGKTIQILMALPNNVPAIVVCPASLKYNWEKEAKKWRPDYKVTILSGRNTFRWPKNGEIVVLNYDILPDQVIMPDNSIPVVNCPANLHVIADEGQKLKGRDTKRFKCFAQWFERATTIWMVTATPLLNRPQELWNLLDVMGSAQKVYSSWQNFVYCFNGYKDGWGYKWGTPRKEAGDLLKKIALRRTKIQVAKDIPPKSSEILNVEFKIDRLTEMLCDEAMEELENNLDGELVFEKLAAARAALAKAKFPALLEVVEEYEEAGEILVVFSHHKFPLEKLVAAKKGWELITGETSVEKRHRIVEDFQAGKLMGLACTIQAGGVGITLTNAANAIFVDLEWTPALNEQAEDRLCRIGQTRPVTIKVLEGGHALDTMVNECIERKKNIIKNSVETIDNVNHNFRPDFQVVNEIPATRKVEKVEKTITIKGQEFKGVVEKINDIETRRGPNSKMEEDAFYALFQVAMMDPDHAAEENGIGFNKLDNAKGHGLVEMGPFHSNADWAAVVNLAHKYGGQTGFSRKNYEEKVLTKKEWNKIFESFLLVFGDEKVAREKMIEKGYKEV